jgi:hypothetical protein
MTKKHRPKENWSLLPFLTLIDSLASAWMCEGMGRA